MSRTDEVQLDPSRHLPVLEEVQGRGNVSQRTIAERLGVAASLVNRVLRELLDEGHLEVVDTNVRPFAYRITDDGKGYLRLLRHEHDRSVVARFRRIERRISRRLEEIRGEGIRRLVLYGAGDVMEVTLPLAEELGLDVVGIVDDDPEKQGEERDGQRVRAPEAIGELEPCAVLVTTYRHAEEILGRLEGGLPEGTEVLEL